LTFQDGPSSAKPQAEDSIGFENGRGLAYIQDWILSIAAEVRMRARLVGLFLAAIASSGFAADDPVFSGPQVGEKLPEFEFRGVYDDQAGQSLDVVSRAAGKPVVLVFVHETTRPGLGLTRVVLDYAARRQQDGLHAAVVFLTDDATETEKWMLIPSVRQNALPKGVAAGIYPEGKEGPGAYGLNRNVSLTVLVAKENRVTANFALVQPSVQADGPKILKAIVDALGGGDVPTLEELGVRADAPRRGEMKKTPGGEAIDAKLRELVGPLLRATTAEEANRAAAKVDAYVAEHADFAKELAVRMRRVAESDKFSEYGQTPEAREHIRRWAKSAAP
jgi:hypothetical protein